ncbi:MAG: hypothetical protein ACI93R_002139 [Flavobacteriales bacterium]|jgi:hypothetical protein
MQTVFLLKNQNNEFLTKSRQWLAAGDCRTLFRSAYPDDVLNEKVELTVKNPSLRIKTIEASLGEKGRLLIDNLAFPRTDPTMSASNNTNLDPASANDSNAGLILSEDPTPSTGQTIDNDLFSASSASTANPSADNVITDGPGTSNPSASNLDTSNLSTNNLATSNPSASNLTNNNEEASA